MTTAEHLYRLAGFTRLPERDRSPALGLSLLAFGLVLPQGVPQPIAIDRSEGTPRTPA